MYLKKDLKIKLINHLTEHLYILELKKSKPHRINECKQLITIISNNTIQPPVDINQLDMFPSVS